MSVLSQKGKPVNIPVRCQRQSGNTTVLEEVLGGAEKRFLCFLTVSNPGSSLAGEWVI